MAFDVQYIGQIHLFFCRFPEVDKLREQLETRSERTSEFKQLIHAEQKELEQEIDDYNDVVLVDVVDHYRNIPLKLLKYLSR